MLCLMTLKLQDGEKMDFLEHIYYELEFVSKLLQRRQAEMYHLQHKMDFLQQAFDMGKKELPKAKPSSKKITRFEQLDMLG